MNLDRKEFIEQFQKRTKRLAIDVIHFSKTLPKSEEVVIMKRQLLRSATSVASNYRAACRARSSAEFHSKISIVIEEADETLFCLELLEESGTTIHTVVNPLMKESSEILSVMAKARKNTTK
ncbi:four helix bundle protein [Pontibacter diazotrophicus]|uniref:Four helix bundle protein n=1 Tax=Pontibacter diazotrophicus TaxID=1400979 RepID=A0A3D8LFA9_9BACT|nr:four helix bundle protein [Pontibacter diazotrophicus]RDV16063.1 four helix bundle protein [Pontibacter diazotrophicus]